MKTLFTLLTLSFVLLQSCKPEKTMTAIEYNDAIIGEQSKIIQLTLDLVKSIETDLDKSEEIRLRTVVQCDSSIAVINRIESFEGGEALKSSALDMIQFYKDVYSNEFKTMIVLLRKGEDITPEDINTFTKINEEVTQREQALQLTFNNAQSEFAKKNNIAIGENALQKDIDALK